MNLNQEILLLLSDFGGEVEFEKPIKVKETPHSPPKEIKSVSSENIPNDEISKATIVQRLKWMIHLKKNKNEMRL